VRDSPLERSFKEIHIPPSNFDFVYNLISSSKTKNYETKNSFIDSHISTPHIKSESFEIEPTKVKLYDLKGKIQSLDEIIFGDKPFILKKEFIIWRLRRNH
jgi:hypothetical protein